MIIKKHLKINKVSKINSYLFILILAVIMIKMNNIIKNYKEKIL